MWQQWNSRRRKSWDSTRFWKEGATNFCNFIVSPLQAIFERAIIDKSDLDPYEKCKKHRCQPLRKLCQSWSRLLSFFLFLLFLLFLLFM
jgi:hypothetical protein